MTKKTITTAAPERRLMGPDEVAEKLGYSRIWLTRNRVHLETLGFPPPVLGGGNGSPYRWDSRAIDLWLDSLLPEALRASDTTGPRTESSLDVQRRLAARAAELRL